MIRAFLIAAAAILTMGAARVPTVDYRLGVVPQAGGAPPLLDVEMRLRGDADGETRLALPDHWASSKENWRHLSELAVQGASASTPDPAHRVLRHRPNAKITVRYRVRTAYDRDPAGVDGNPYKGPLIRPDWFAAMGEFVFAAPEGREHLPATFRWGKLPKGWRVASDLEHGRMGRPMTVYDVGSSVSVGGARVTVVQRQIPGGVLRLAAPGDSPVAPDAMADRIARVVGQHRAFWNDLNEPYFVAYVPLSPRPTGSSSGGTGRGDAFVLYGTPNATDRLDRNIAHEHIHAWIPRRTGRMPQTGEAAAYWFSEGFTDFVTDRLAIRSALEPQDAVLARMSERLKAYDDSPVRTAPNARIVADFWTDQAVKDLAYQRGFLLALKWDDDIRRATAGQRDLDDVILRMRDHFREFPPGQAPDVVTGLVSAAWVVARVDLRPDIQRHVERGEAIPLPDALFDGCLEVRLFNRPAFDTGFDHKASIAAKKVSGVRRGGPAWNSGLRNGMALVGATVGEGDTTREAQFTVQPPGRRAKPRVYRYWPYGDDRELSTRTLALKSGLAGEALAACGRKVGGL